MSHKYRVSIGCESPSRGITRQLEPRRRNRLRFRLPRPLKQRKRFFAPFVRVQKGLACRVSGKGQLPAYRQTYFGASMRRSHVQHDTARVPRRTPFWPKPQKGAKALFPVHPAALINEPPAPHRERQVAAKGGMLQTRSRPQSCGFRPPVLAAIAKRRNPPSPRRGFTRLPRCPPPKSSRHNPCTAARRTASPDRPG